jgi:hypothetical protein
MSFVTVAQKNEIEWSNERARLVIFSYVEIQTHVKIRQTLIFFVKHFLFFSLSLSLSCHLCSNDDYCLLGREEKEERDCEEEDKIC